MRRFGIGDALADAAVTASAPRRDRPQYTQAAHAAMRRRRLMKSSTAVRQNIAAAGVRAFLCGAAMIGVLSCGVGGGGDDPGPTRQQRPEGVYSGFNPAPGITLEQAL